MERYIYLGDDFTEQSMLEYAGLQRAFAILLYGEGAEGRGKGCGIQVTRNVESGYGLQAGSLQNVTLTWQVSSADSSSSDVQRLGQTFSVDIT